MEGKGEGEGEGEREGEGEGEGEERVREGEKGGEGERKKEYGIEMNQSRVCFVMKLFSTKETCITQKRSRDLHSHTRDLERERIEVILHVAIARVCVLLNSSKKETYITQKRPRDLR